VISFNFYLFKMSYPFFFFPLGSISDTFLPWLFSN
jgi:hypothetical protein